MYIINVGKERRRKKGPALQRRQDKIPVKGGFAMKYEALKEVIEKMRQKSKSNSETLISTILPEILNLITKAERGSC